MRRGLPPSLSLLDDPAVHARYLQDTDHRVDRVLIPVDGHGDATTALRQIWTSPPSAPAHGDLPPHAESEPLMPVPTHPAEALKSCFTDVFGCRGREFGSRSRDVLGISDGNEGVQWNAGYYPRDGAVWLGVNLEGMKYDDWPVARLIEREISRPLLLTRYRREVARPDRVIVIWARDAWQYSARRRIKEANVTPTPIALDRLDGQGWADALRGARECLDPGGSIGVAGRFGSRCCRRNGTLGNDRLRWM